jgi:hypothetical protein
MVFGIKVHKACSISWVTIKFQRGYAEQTSTQYGATAIKQSTDLKYGLIDSLGNVIIPIEYNAIIPYYGNLLVQKR